MRTRAVRVVAPAKVNLFLAVEGRRPDGWHAVETVYQAIDLADKIEFRPRPSGIHLVSDWEGLPTGEGNLCWQAAALLQEKSGTERGVEIRLHKRIPPGAGLGGGSSDAAATLKALNRLWGLGLSAEELQKCAASLGADVAFFLQGGTALGRSRGEAVSSLPTPQLWFVLAWPRMGLSTAAVYQEWDEQPCRESGSLREMLEALESKDTGKIASCMRNDLERAAARLCPVCADLKKELLEEGCPGALVCGSGSAVFGIARDSQQARETAVSLSESRGVWTAVTKTVSAGERNDPICCW